jgi:hypothetical protein
VLAAPMMNIVAAATSPFALTITFNVTVSLSSDEADFNRRRLSAGDGGSGSAALAARLRRVRWPDSEAGRRGARLAEGAALVLEAHAESSSVLAALAPVGSAARRLLTEEEDLDKAIVALGALVSATDALDVALPVLTQTLASSNDLHDATEKRTETLITALEQARACGTAKAPPPRPPPPSEAQRPTEVTLNSLYSSPNHQQCADADARLHCASAQG